MLIILAQLSLHINAAFDVNVASVIKITCSLTSYPSESSVTSIKILSDKKQFFGFSKLTFTVSLFKMRPPNT